MLAIKIIAIVIIAYIIFRMTLFFIVYKKVFINDLKGYEDPYSIPDRKIYQDNKEKIYALVDEFEAIEYEEVECQSFDNLILKGRLYAGNEKAPVIICFHGYKSAALRDAGLSIRLNRQLGFNVIVVDQRAHGKSGGTALTFGAKEKRDVISWCEFAKTRFGRSVEIGLCGLSMGATTVILAAGLDFVPRNIKGIIADCPFSSAYEMIRLVIKSLKAPVGISYYGISTAGATYGKINLKDANAVEAARKSRIPILLIHGENDAFVPCWMSEKIYAANPKMITFNKYPGADHGLSFIIDSERYEKDVLDFWHKVLDYKF